MKKVLPALLLALLVGCSSDGKNADDAGTDADADTDSDTDTDTECVPYDTFDPEDCPDVADITDCVVYVDADAPSSGDGRSWATALPDLQDGLDLATCGVLTTDYCQSWQVWAAEGSYHAWRTCELNTFWVRSGVHLYGGFAGNESSTSERDIEANPTVLDGRDGPESENRVYNIAVVYGDDIRLDGITLTGGSAHGDDFFAGGGVLTADSTVVIEGCTFEDNSAYQGGGIYAYATDVELIDCVFRANDAKIGGGVYLISTLASIDGCTFEANAASYEDDGWGGGLYLGSGTSAQVTDSWFLDNTAAFSAAGISIYEANVSLAGCTLSGNESPNAGALIAENSELVIDDVVFDTNSATEDEGQAGAAVFVGGLVDIADSVFTGNSAAIGGGLLASECQLDITGTEFEGNSVDMFGGALFAQLGSTQVFGCTFADNSAGENGGGVSLVQNESVHVSNTLFAGNTSQDVAGAFSTGGNESLVVERCTFAGNASESGGSTVDIENEHLELTDSILWDDCSPTISAHDGATAEVTYSDVRGGWAGEGNIDADPLFVDPDGGDFCLQEGSPCIGVASDAGEMGYCPFV